MPASRRAKQECCATGFIQKLAKLLTSLQLFSQTVLELFSPRFAFCKGNALFAKLRAEFFNLCLVPSLRLGKELLVELLNLRDFFRNEDIEAANGAGKQIGFALFWSRRSLGGHMCVRLSFRCFRDQSAIKLDYFRSDSGINEMLNCEMSMAPSLFYQCRSTGNLFVGQPSECPDAP